VEIRNVETGSMSQVIQGNNLRCLYTDSPLQHAHSRHSQSSFSSSSLYGTSSGFVHGNQPYPPSSHGYNGRTSLPAGYGQSPVPPYPGQPPTSYGRAAGREEIILVSDDRVLTLRMAALPGQ
jgi:hypothetical protein